MNSIPARDLQINWKDLEQVKALADKLGPGMSVIKRPEIPNYNITHTERGDLLIGAQVMYQTPRKRRRR